MSYSNRDGLSQLAILNYKSKINSIKHICKVEGLPNLLDATILNLLDAGSIRPDLQYEFVDVTFATKVITLKSDKASTIDSIYPNGTPLAITDFIVIAGGSGGGGTETDPVYLAEKDIDGTLSANSDSKVATQKAIKLYIDTAVARSTITNKTTLNGAIPVSNVKITPTILTSANFPGLTNDGDYYTFSATDVGVNKSHYTFPNSITYKVAVGDKIQFNKTDNDYLFYSAGQNQIASEVPATAIVASSTTIGVPGTNAQQQIADLATAIKNLGTVIPTKLARIAGDIYGGNDFYLEDPEIVIVPAGKTAIVDTLEYRVNSGTVNTGGNVFTVNAYTPAVYNTGTGTPATPVLLGNIGTVTIAPTTRAITVVLNSTVANRTFISSFQIAIVNTANEFGIADHFGLLTTIK